MATQVNETSVGLNSAQHGWIVRVLIIAVIVGLCSLSYIVYACNRANDNASFEALHALDTKGVAVEYEHRYKGTRAFIVHEADGDSVQIAWTSKANLELFVHIMTGDTVELRGSRDMAVVTGYRAGVLRVDTFKLFSQ